MTTGGKDRGSREARERARVYQARQAFHDGQQRRRVRDNLIAGVAGGAVILAIVIAQTVYFTAGPGAPSPSPTPTTTSTPVPSGTPSPDPTASETPTPEPSASE